MIDREYYLNVRELMDMYGLELARPTLKIIHVLSGEDPTWQETLSCNGVVVVTVSNQHSGWRLWCWFMVSMSKLVHDVKTEWHYNYTIL